MNIDFITNDTFRATNLSGIYVIIHRQKNVFYIGQSINIKKRWEQHITNLRNNRHTNPMLQAYFNKFGEHTFEFKVLQPYFNDNAYTTKLDLLILEKAYIDHYRDKYRLFNMEDSIHVILKEETPYTSNRYEIVFKTNLIRRILQTDIIWHEYTPCIIEANPIDIYLKTSKVNQSKLRAIKDRMPQDIFDECISERHLVYTDHNGAARDMISLLVKKEDPLIAWLIQMKYTTQEYITATKQKIYGDLVELSE